MINSIIDQLQFIGERAGINIVLGEAYDLLWVLTVQGK